MTSVRAPRSTRTAKSASSKSAHSKKKPRVRAYTPPTTSSSDRTRELLLSAAKKLFALKGYDATSVQELAREAGVNVSLVSYHFQGKKGLYRACLGQFGRERLAVAMRILVPPQNSEEFRVRLGLFIEEMIVCHVSEPELGRIVHRECEMALPVIPDIFKDTFLKVFETLLAFFAAAARKGIVRDDVEPHFAGMFLFGSILHAFKAEPVGQKYFGFSIEDPKFRKKLTEAALKIFYRGLTT